MAMAPPLKRFCKEAVCSVCPNYLKNPVTIIVECSHSFCPACLDQCWRESEESCPLCQENVQTRDKYLKIVTEEKEKILAHKEVIMKESQALLEQTKSETQKTVAEFGKLHRFLEEQEKLLLGKMALLEKEIARERDERLVRLSSELSCLESLIRDMEEKQQQPAVELLQDVRSTLKKYKEKQKFGELVAFAPELKCKIWDVGGVNDLLEVHMKKFKATVNRTLDPGEKESQELPKNPERFDIKPCVKGGEESTAGQHLLEEPTTAISSCRPKAVPGASSSSFSSHQMTLDATQTSPPSQSVSVSTVSASAEPVALSASGTLESANSISGNLEEVCKGILNEWSPGRILESERAQTGAEESEQREDAFLGASPQADELEPQPSASAFRESPQLPPPTPPTAMENEAPLEAKRLSRRVPPRKRYRSPALTGAATSAGIPAPLASSSPTKVTPPSKRPRRSIKRPQRSIKLQRSSIQRPRTSIVWQHFTRRSTFWANCDICKMDVKIGNPEGCGSLGTASLLYHLRHNHPEVFPKAPSTLHV